MRFVSNPHQNKIKEGKKHTQKPPPSPPPQMHHLHVMKYARIMLYDDDVVMFVRYYILYTIALRWTNGQWKQFVNPISTIPIAGIEKSVRFSGHFIIVMLKHLNIFLIIKLVRNKLLCCRVVTARLCTSYAMLYNTIQYYMH